MYTVHCNVILSTHNSLTKWSLEYKEIPKVFQENRRILKEVQATLKRCATKPGLHLTPSSTVTLREVDREWALVMNHQISLTLTI